MALIAVGSVAYDGVETPHGKVDRMLGGAATYISLSASYFTPVRLVAVVGDDFASEDADLLSSRGVDLSGLERVAGGKSFFWQGVYSADMNDRTTLRTDLNVFADFNPALPESYRSEPYLMLGNIQPALQSAVRSQMAGMKIAGGDTMNYWIDTARAELLAAIREWDFLLINDGEARLLSGDANLRRAAAKIVEMGPRVLVIKRGEYGAVLVREGRRELRHFMAPGYLLERRIRSHRRGRLLRRRLHRLSGRARRRSARRTDGIRGAATRRDLRLGNGQLLLRAFRRGPFPHARARGDRGPIPGVPGNHGVLNRKLGGTPAHSILARGKPVVADI